MGSLMEGEDSMRMKLAVALAMWKTSIRCESAAEENQWRKKAKLLEQECSKATKELEELKGALVLDQLPLLAPCKCHFFKPTENAELVKGAWSAGETTYDGYIRKNSVQTFLRNVRILRRMKQQTIGDRYDETQEHLAAVIEFVIDLSCQTKPTHLKGTYAEAYMHHAVDFIKDTVPLLLERNEEKNETVDNLITKLVLDMVGKVLNFTADEDSGECGLDDQERILGVMLNLAESAYIGHRLLLSSSQQIATVVERLQCMDPFDDGFSQTYENLYFMFQLIDTLVSEHIFLWKKDNNDGQGILEEWIACHFHCKTAIEERPTAWSSPLTIAMDGITARLLERLQNYEDSDLHRQDMWQKALIQLISSASSALTEF